MSAFVEPSSPHVMNTYGRLPIALSHGQGCRVWDTNGKAYLDGLGGIAAGFSTPLDTAFSTGLSRSCQGIAPGSRT